MQFARLGGCSPIIITTASKVSDADGLMVLVVDVGETESRVLERSGGGLCL